MGCNYYVKINECKCCGRYELIHLGKASAGWKFIFAYNNGEYYKSFAEMLEWLKDKVIENEYGDVEPLEEFKRYVEKLQADKTTLSHIEYCKQKYPSMVSDYIKDSEGYEFTTRDFS